MKARVTIRLQEIKDVKFLRMENTAAVYAVGSGTHRFQLTLNEAPK